MSVPTNEMTGLLALPTEILNEILKRLKNLRDLLAVRQVHSRLCEIIDTGASSNQVIGELITCDNTNTPRYNAALYLSIGALKDLFLQNISALNAKKPDFRTKVGRKVEAILENKKFYPVIPIVLQKALNMLDGKNTDYLKFNISHEQHRKDILTLTSNKKSLLQRAEHYEMLEECYYPMSNERICHQDQIVPFRERAREIDEEIKEIEAITQFTPLFIATREKIDVLKLQINTPAILLNLLP